MLFSKKSVYYITYATQMHVCVPDFIFHFIVFYFSAYFFCMFIVWHCSSLRGQLYDGTKFPCVHVPLVFLKCTLSCTLPASPCHQVLDVGCARPSTDRPLFHTARNTFNDRSFASKHTCAMRTLTTTVSGVNLKRTGFMVAMRHCA